VTPNKVPGHATNLYQADTVTNILDTQYRSQSTAALYDHNTNCQSYLPNYLHSDVTKITLKSECLRLRHSEIV